MSVLSEENIYIAIIGDIIDSRSIEERKLVQEKLKSVLEEINRKYFSEIAANFIITLGDEFQGLLLNGNNVIDIIHEIQMTMFPVKIRFGLGVGEISTEINSQMSIGADGPAFYRARNAIEFLKKSEQKNKTQSAEIRIEMKEEKQRISDMINTIFSLVAVLKNGWTIRQREIICDYLEHMDGQKKCAERLKITQSSVQRGLVGGNFYAYWDALCVIKKVLGDELEIV